MSGSNTCEEKPVRVELRKTVTDPDMKMSGSSAEDKVTDPDMISRPKIDVRIGLPNKVTDPDFLQIHTSHVRIDLQKQVTDPEDVDPDNAMSGSTSRAAGTSGSTSKLETYSRFFFVQV